MSGHLRGVQTILQEKLGRSIPYIRCFSHRLHLVVVDAIKQIDLIKTFFEQTNMLYKFFQLYIVKKIYKGKTLKRLIVTRWEGHHRSTQAIYENVNEIISFFQSISDDSVEHGLNGEEIATSTGILTSHVHFEGGLRLFHDFRKKSAGKFEAT